MQFCRILFDVVELDDECFHRIGQGYRRHIDAAQVFGLVILGAPLASLLIDDELGAVLGGKGVDGVGADWNGEGSNFEGRWEF